MEGQQELWDELFEAHKVANYWDQMLNRLAGEMGLQVTNPDLMMETYERFAILHDLGFGIPFVYDHTIGEQNNNA